jgi:hypothetical protein
MKAEWEVHENGIRYVLARRVSEWALGSGYRFYRTETDKVKRFWRRKSALQFADKLNYAAERLP